MTKRLLFVTSRLPWPQNSGRKVSLYHYCRGLHEKYGYRIALFVFPEWDQERDATNKPDFISEVRFAHPIGRATKLLSLIRHSLFGKEPFQCALYYSRKNREALAQFVSDFSPDVMLFDMIRTAPYMTDHLGKRRCVLDLDDLLSVRYARQLAADNDGAGIAGRYAGGMSPLAERLLCHGRVGRAILSAEQRRVARAELSHASAADGVILVSKKEAETLNTALGRCSAVAVPMGVDVAAFSAAREQEKAPRTAGFLGNLHVAANAASLEWIAEEILPRMRDLHFEVAGPCPDALRSKYAACRNLHFLGEVDDPAAVMGRWQLTVAPIAFGSGIKTKMLEAMAAGLPVVTNTTGAEGIGAAHGAEIFVADTAEEIAATADRLLADTALCREVGARAAAFVQKEFAWDTVFEEFKKLDL